MYLSSLGIKRETYDRKILDILKTFKIDLVYLVGYMKIVSNVLIDGMKGKIFNIHPSLLPKFGGKMDLSVHDAVLESNEKITGCTLHEVTEEVDGGKIVLQKQLFIGKNKNIDADKLKERVQNLEKDALVEFISIYRNMLSTPYTSKKYDDCYKKSGVDVEKGNTQAVLDGSIDDFIQAALSKKIGLKK